VGESFEWTSILSSVEENTANFCKAVDGKPDFSALSAVCGMYDVTLNELKAVLKVSAHAGQSDAMSKTSVRSTAHDDYFQEVKRRRRRISNNTSQTAEKSSKPVPTTATVKLPPKATFTRNFFTALRTTDMVMETTGAEITLPEQEAPRKSRRPPPIMMTSTTKLIPLQSDLKTMPKEITGSEMYEMEPV
jgi:hypothetical protein